MFRFEGEVVVVMVLNGSISFYGGREQKRFIFSYLKRWNDCLPVGFGGVEKNEENEEWLARGSVRICAWIRGRKDQPVRRRTINFYSYLY